MYNHEYYLTAIENGLTNVEIDVGKDLISTVHDNGTVEIDSSQITVSFEFAVTTESVATLAIDGDGLVYVAFGGTGTTDRELDEYAEQAVAIWRYITDDHATVCRYKIRESDDRDQMNYESIIHA